MNRKKVNKSRPKRKKTDYTLKPDQLNLVEIRRKLNKDKIKLNKKHIHCKELYDLEKRKLEYNKNLYRLKKEEDLQKSKKLLIFKPKLDQRSKTLMKGKKEPLLNRMENWLKERDHKLEILKTDKKKKDDEKFRIVMKPKINRNKIKAASKVRIFLEHFEETMKREYLKSSRDRTSRGKTTKLEKVVKDEGNFESLKKTVKKDLFAEEEG